MELKEAIKLVKLYQKWRRGKIEGYPIDPKELGIALDVLIENAESTYASNYLSKKSKNKPFKDA